MRAPSPVRIPIAVLAHLLAGIRGLAFGPTRWRRFFRAVAVVLAVALFLGGLAAVPARPALAAPVPVNPVNPGGNFSWSVPFLSATPAVATTVVDDLAPESVGLPDGSSASAMMAAVQQATSASGDGQEPPPTCASCAVSVTPATPTAQASITVTANATDIPATNNPSGSKGPLASFLSGLINLGVYDALMVSCVGYTGIVARLPALKISPSQKNSCTIFATWGAGWTGFAYNQYLNADLPSGAAWQNTLVNLLNTAITFKLVGSWVTPWLEEFIFDLGQSFGQAAAPAFSALCAWIPGCATLSSYVSAYYLMSGGTVAVTRPQFNAVLAAMGLPVARATGTIIDSALGTPSLQCMDAYDANGTPFEGDPAAINLCSSSQDADQDWEVWSNGEVSNGGLCLDITGASWRTLAKLELWECQGSWNQTWSQKKTPIYGKPYVQNAPGGSGNCIDDPNWDTTPGTQLQDQTCTGTTAQQWEEPGYSAASTGTGPTATGYGPVTSGLPGECMDAYGASPGASGGPSPGQIVAINGCNGNIAQDWTPQSDGTVTDLGLCLDTSGGTSAAGTPLVDLEACSGAASQAWAQQSDGALLNTASGLCLDDPGSSTTAGTQLQLYGCDGGANQVWTLPGASTLPSSPPTPPANASVCDIYATGGTPCAAAYSMDRALYVGYDGPLYQVTRASDNTSTNIGLLKAGGDVNASEQDSFCAGTTCQVTEIYDQSPNGNNLTVFTAGGGADHNPDPAADATALPIKMGGANGTEAYGLDIANGAGYRLDTTHGVVNNDPATGGTPGQGEGMYMVASGTNFNSGCCFDFGNAETNNDDDQAGAMDAVNFSNTCYFQSSQGPCTGSGPWVEADLEDGLFQGGNGTNTANTPLRGDDFVTAMLKNNGTNTYALKGASAQSGTLNTYWEGSLPTITTSGTYQPMRQQGAIILGTGGDNSNGDVGSFFEGVMTNGYPTDATDALVQANIVAAGYYGTTSPVAAEIEAASAAGPAVVHSAGAPAGDEAGYSSVFTVDSANGHLQESYLPHMGGSWSTQDLSTTNPTMPDTPAVMPGTKPVAITHCGYTSVYTIDAGDATHGTGDLQESFLPAIGDPIGWRTQDLTQLAPHTPPSDVTPTAVEHYAGDTDASTGCGFTSVYTVARDGDLWETYLPNAGFPGDAWSTQDLSSSAPQMAQTPAVLAGTSPVAIVHCGYTSVYTVDASDHHLQETYLPAVGDSWGTQDLSRNYGTAGATTYNAPPTSVTPTAVMHSAGAPGGSSDCGYTSVFTVDDVTQNLQETYLPNGTYGPDDPWHSQDLTTISSGPGVAPGTAPVALVHMGFTSVYTIAEGSNHLQETWLPYIGFPGNWQTQDLSRNYGVAGATNYNTPPTDQTPIVLLHPDFQGNLDWTSVFTIDEFNDHLQESYLPNTGFPGDPWITQDLSSATPSTMPSTPPVAVLQSQQSDWSVAHDGYTSVYTVQSDGDLQESYLKAMGATWATQDLSSSLPNMAQTPAVAPGTTPIAVTHDGVTSVFTIDKGGDGTHNAGDLQETWLPALGGPWYTHDLSSSQPDMAQTPAVAPGSSPTAVFHDGYLSVFTIDKGGDGTHNPGDLQETYLPALDGPWYTHDLSSNATGMPQTPAAGESSQAPTSPVAILHDGYTSVFTVDAATGDLQETWLAVLGGPWETHNLSQMAGTPEISPGTNPTAVFHNGYLSVYTVNATFPYQQGDLEETRLPAIGDNWVSQDLTANDGAPPASGHTSPVALYHTGFTSVYYLDGTSQNFGHLIEAFLPAISDAWGYNDLTADNPPATPLSLMTPSPLVHYDTRGALTWTSVFTIDGSPNDLSYDLQETWLQAIGDKWATQNLSTENPPATPPW